MSYTFKLTLKNEFKSGDISLSGGFTGAYPKGKHEFPPKTQSSAKCTVVMALPRDVLFPTWLSIDIRGGTYVLTILELKKIQLEITNSSDSTTNVTISDVQ